MKNILIALDYNPTAEKVANIGYTIAKDMDASIVLLHVISNLIDYPTYEYSAIMGYNGYWDSVTIEIVGVRKSMEGFLEATKKHLGESSISIRVEEGNYAETILNTARQLHVDLIVLGSHSQRWLENILMGSVTKDVLRRTDIPLLIIPTKMDESGI